MRSVRLHVFSDLHVDAGRRGWQPRLAPGANVVVCAGDVCEGLADEFAFLRDCIPAPTPIVTVAGNHSFYGRDLERELAAGPAVAEAASVTFLENDQAVIDGVRFVGSTLWTDYRLYGETNQPRAMRNALHGMNDHRCIGWGRRRPGSFRPSHALSLHERSRAFLEDVLAKPFDGPTVVVTHHAPSAGSIAKRYRGDIFNPAFVSDLSELITRHQPTLWIHGHVHSSFDYRIGPTRVLCNPHGYGLENAQDFKPDLTVELP